MNGLVINKVPKILAPIPSKNMNAIQIMSPFNTTHPIIVPLQLTGIINYFDAKKPTLEEYGDQDILKIELMAEAHTLYP